MRRSFLEPYRRDASLFDLMSEFESFFRPTSERDENQTNNLAWRPAVDVEESEMAYLLSFDLPGVKKEDIKIDLKDRRLTVTGTRTKESQSEQGGKLHQYERMHGEFHRSFVLPDGVDAEKIEANYDDGVLELAIPKKEESKARDIQIGQGRSGFFSKLLNSSTDKKEERAH